MIEDEYRSIQARVETTIKVKGSSFIATAAPVASETSAAAFIHEISRIYHDATHHCFAYRLGFDDHLVQRSSDDGEPSGTAGRPILQAVAGRQLTHTAVVVTRYFGGTKLGTGGLIRAYADAAAVALDRAQIAIHVVRRSVRVKFPYDETSAVMRLIGSIDGRVTETLYGQDTEMVVDVRLREMVHFREGLIDATRGRVTILGE